MTYPTAVSKDIAAPAQKVWAMVSDLPRMGEWSPENQGGRWVDGATVAAPGVVFRGKNKNGLRRWSTKVTVVECQPGKVFEIAVTFATMAVANWRYDFEDTATGCRVTESWQDHRAGWQVRLGSPMGDHSQAHAAQEMQATLDNLAAAAESAS
jgi:hypothetical protein